MKSGADRRRHDRLSVRVQAEFRAGAAWAQRGLLTDLSNDGAFAAIPPTLGPGQRVTVRFRHPNVPRLITTSAVVARRILPGASATEDPGLGLYFLEKMSNLASERRSEDRHAISAGAQLEVAGDLVACRLVDLSDHGATVELDLGFKRMPGATPTPTGRANSVGMRLRAGISLRIRFQDPATKQTVTLRGVVSRNPTPAGEGRPEYRFGLAFDKPLSSWRAGRRRSLSPAAARSPDVRVTGGADLDLLATRELAMRSLLRGVEWTGRHGSGYGRLVLAGKRKMLVQSSDLLPARGSTLRLTMLTPDDSSCPPLRVHMVVEAAGEELVAGREPGFVASVRSFVDPRDEPRYAQLVDWLTSRGG